MVVAIAVTILICPSSSSSTTIAYSESCGPLALDKRRRCGGVKHKGVLQERHTVHVFEDCSTKNAMITYILVECSVRGKYVGIRMGIAVEVENGAGKRSRNSVVLR